MRKRKLEMSSRSVTAVLCLGLMSSQVLRGEPAAPPPSQTATPAPSPADGPQPSADATSQSIELLASNSTGALDRRDWRGTIGSTVKFLMAEHAGRILFQEKTRRE